MSQQFNDLRKQMFSGFRKDKMSAKSIVAMVLFTAIILVFVFFGLPNRLNGGTGSGMGSAARVNNTLIPVSDLSSESSRLEQMYAPLFGGNGIGDAQRQFVRQQALESLIVQELASQGAKSEGILATDTELQDVIVHDITAFQKDGRFQRELYYQILEANRLNAKDFENKIRKEKMNNRTQKLFEVASHPLSFEVEKLKQLHETQKNVAFARVDKEKVLSQMKISDSDVQTHLANADFAKKVDEYYKANKAEFSVAPEVHAQHILIKTEPGKEAEGLQKIQDLKKRAEKEDFSALATKYSDDSGSKVKGGDLGFFGKGRMVPEFEKAAFEGKIGAISEPVKSPFGYHLIKVLEKKEAREKPLDEVRKDIAHKLVATEMYDSEMKALEEGLAKNESSAVDNQLKKMGVNWEETGYFDLAADSIPKLSSAEASHAALELTEEKTLYPTVVKDNGEKYVLKLKGSKKETAKADKDPEATLARERSSDLFRSWIENAKKSAHIERNESVLTGRL